MHLVLVSLFWTFTTPVAAKSAGSCVDWLAGRPRKSMVWKLDFDRSGRRAREKYAITAEHLESFVSREGLTLVPHQRGGLYAVVFDFAPSRRGNQGYLLKGERVNDRFVVHSFYRSSLHEELTYYHRVAEAHGVEPMQIQLRRALLRCPSLVIQGFTQVKLWIKHRMGVHDVSEFLDTVRRPPALDDEVTSPAKHLIEDMDSHGRHVRAVVRGGLQCPNEVVSAYEVLEK